MIMKFKYLQPLLGFKFKFLTDTAMKLMEKQDVEVFVNKPNDINDIDINHFVNNFVNDFDNDNAMFWGYLNPFFKFKFLSRNTNKNKPLENELVNDNDDNGSGGGGAP